MAKHGRCAEGPCVKTMLCDPESGLCEPFLEKVNQFRIPRAVHAKVVTIGEYESPRMAQCTMTASAICSPNAAFAEVSESPRVEWFVVAVFPVQSLADDRS